jgi:hypothetical protein
MRSRLVIIVIFISICTLMQAQSASGVDLLSQLSKAGERDKVTVEADSLLVANYYKLRLINKKITGVPGFRIRIFSESGIGAKEQQQRLRARFLSLYPEVDAYYKYDEPYFKVYVGDCRTRSEALKLYDQIKRDFPNPILREDYINIK